MEYTETHNLVPMLEGRSSIGRLGLYIHVTAGFRDIGFKGHWTLELHCVEPIRIYSGVEMDNYSITPWRVTEICNTQAESIKEIMEYNQVNFMMILGWQYENVWNVWSFA